MKHWFLGASFSFKTAPPRSPFWREFRTGVSFQPENWKVLKSSMCPETTNLFLHAIFMTLAARPLRFTPATNLIVQIKAILTGDDAAAQNTCTFTQTALPGKSAQRRGVGKRRNKTLKKSVSPS